MGHGDEKCVVCVAMENEQSGRRVALGFCIGLRTGEFVPEKLLANLCAWHREIVDKAAASDAPSPLKPKAS